MKKQLVGSLSTHAQKQVFSHLSPNAQIDFHVRAFDLPPSPWLDAYWGLLKRWPSIQVETGVKLSGETVDAERIYLYLPTGVEQAGREHWDAMREFVRGVAETYGAAFNESLLNEVVDDEFDFSTVLWSILGMDHRADPRESRGKLSLIVRSYPALVERVLALSGREEEIRPLLLESTFLFAFDFQFNGGTQLKIYPRFSAPLLAREDVRANIRSGWGERVNMLADMCQTVHVKFEDKRGGRSFGFHPHYDQVDRLVDAIDDSRLSKIHSIYKGKLFFDYAFVMHEDDIARNTYPSLNAYYYGMMAFG